MESLPDRFEMESGNKTPMQEWLGFEPAEGTGRYRLKYLSHHIGNPLIRAIHGGVAASLIEMSAEQALLEQLGDKIDVRLISSSVDYLRVSKDQDILAKAEIVKIGRRLAYVDVWCWQDREDTPISRGTCTLRIEEKPEP